MVFWGKCGKTVLKHDSILLFWEMIHPWKKNHQNVCESIFFFKCLNIFSKNNRYIFTVRQITEDNSSPVVWFLTSHKRNDQVQFLSRSLTWMTQYLSKWERCYIRCLSKGMWNGFWMFHSQERVFLLESSPVLEWNLLHAQKEYFTSGYHLTSSCEVEVEGERWLRKLLLTIKSCGFVELLFLLPNVDQWHKALLMFPPFLKQS